MLRSGAGLAYRKVAEDFLKDGESSLPLRCFAKKEVESLSFLSFHILFVAPCSSSAM